MFSGSFNFASTLHSNVLMPSFSSWFVLIMFFINLIFVTPMSSTFNLITIFHIVSENEKKGGWRRYGKKSFSLRRVLCKRPQGTLTDNPRWRQDWYHRFRLRVHIRIFHRNFFLTYRIIKVKGRPTVRSSYLPLSLNLYQVWVGLSRCFTFGWPDFSHPEGMVGTLPIRPERPTFFLLDERTNLVSV